MKIRDRSFQEQHMARLLEICLAGIESALSAQDGGAQRIELCENLIEGGTTPSYGTIAAVTDRLSIDVHVIVRPRGGDSCHSTFEYDSMLRDVGAIKRLGAQGIVTGILSPDGSVDEVRTRHLVEQARPMRVTFHRAFDQARDPYEALDMLIRLGIERVLTSGQAPTAWQGREMLAQLTRQAGNDIIVMAGGGITAGNVAGILKHSGVNEVHVGSFCETDVESEMDFRATEILIKRAGIKDDYTLRRTSNALVAEMRAALDAA